MSKKYLNSKLIGTMGFATNIDGHTIITDADEKIGGNNFGPRPKALVLSALVGCMGYNTMLIIRKMKICIDDLNVEIEADDGGNDSEPYEYVNMIWKFKGENLPLDKLQTAVNLSHDKYCGVSQMLQASLPINIDIILEE